MDYLYGARYRLLATTVTNFRKSDVDLVESRLQAAVNAAVEVHNDTLVESLKRHTTSLDASANNKFFEVIYQAYLAAKFSGGAVELASEVDLCKLGLAVVLDRGNVRTDDDQRDIVVGEQFRVSERFALETIKNFVLAHPEAVIYNEFKSRVADLDGIVRELSKTTTVKGNIFEAVVLWALYAQANGAPDVLKLPLVAGHRSDPASAEVLSGLSTESSAWSGVKFACSGITPAAAEDGFATTAASLLARPTELHMPEKSHRADALVALEPNFLLAAGMKLYSSTVPSKEVRSQYRATNPEWAYELADAYDRPKAELSSRLNPSASTSRAAWVAGGFDKRIALRVHVVLPRSAKPKDATDGPVPLREYTPGLFAGEGGSIVVNIDSTNFFLLVGTDEAPVKGIDKETRERLFRVLRVVTEVEFATRSVG